MAHDIVAAFLFAGDGHVVIDVVAVRLQLGELLVGDGEALPLLGPRQRDPQPAPCFEFVVLGKNILHLLRRVAGGKRRKIGIVRHHKTSVPSGKRGDAPAGPSFSNH